MALTPPERITVKRRRDEDPVEALYIEQRKKRLSAIWRLADKENTLAAYAVPLPLSSPARGVRSTIESSLLSDARVHLETTRPNENSHKRKDAIPSLLQDDLSHAQRSPQAEKRPPAPCINRPIRRSEKSQDLDKASSQPRMFHLTKASLPMNSLYVVSKSTARVGKRARKDDLPIFEETKEKLLEAIHAHENKDAKISTPGLKDITSNGSVSIPESKPIRKRPNATTEEQKWRADNWKKPAEPNANTRKVREPAHKLEFTSQWNVESPDLAEQLQQIALQEIQAEEQRASVKSSNRQLKTQPTPPVPRQAKMQQTADTEDGDVKMADTSGHNEESDYVFDTYIRSIAPLTGSEESTELQADPLHGIDYGNIGILVIDNEEQELWDTYGEAQESDPEWNSEEEDENAEDFYGNDYPEDEVNTDDEFGRGAYNYRHGVSDDEECGEGMATWSDEEDEA